MSQIKVYADPDNDVTTIALSGVVTIDRIISALVAFYNDAPTRLLLWDLSQADLVNLNSDGLKKILSTAKAHAHLRKEGKSAVLTSGDYAFGMGRMYAIFAELYEHPVEHMAFKTHEDAMKWLLGDK